MVKTKFMFTQSGNTKLIFKVFYYQDIYRPEHFIVEII